MPGEIVIVIVIYKKTMKFIVTLSKLGTRASGGWLIREEKVRSSEQQGK